MYDYNWWDDRTEDLEICPITMQSCYNSDECEICEVHKKFVEYYMKEDKNEKPE